MVHTRTDVTYVYVRTYNVIMSQLSDWKRAHMCTENLATAHELHHCLDGEVYRGNRHYNDVGLDTNQSLHHPPERDVLGCRSPWVRESAAGRYVRT